MEERGGGHVRVSLLQWNVWMDEDPSRIAGVIAKINPDVACLQEVMTSSTGTVSLLDILWRDVGLRGPYAPAHSVLRGDLLAERGNAVLARLPATAVREIHLRPYTDRILDDQTQGRAYVEATFAFGSGLTVGSTHLSYTPGFATPAWKHVEFAALFDAVRHHQRGTVIAGDLNATPASPGVQLLRTQFRDAGPPADVHTWTTKPYRDATFTETKLAWRLDHVFVTHDIHVVNASVVDTDVSDHLPILVTLDIDARPIA